MSGQRRETDRVKLHQPGACRRDRPEDQRVFALLADHREEIVRFHEVGATARAQAVIVRLAVNAHWVEFRGKQRFVIS